MYFKEMCHTNLKFLLSTACAVVFLFFSTAIAQEPQAATVKRNSPFSPNPKKKGEVTPTPSQVPTKTPSENVAALPNDSLISVTRTPAPDKDTPTSATPDTKSAGTDNSEGNPGPAKVIEVARNTEEQVRPAISTTLLPTDIYKIGPGDVLLIALQNVPVKESTYFTVLKDGTIDYPLAGESIALSGLTASEAEELLKSRIKLYENPQVSVKVREFNSHAISVLGMVPNPGEMFLRREAQPLFVIRSEAEVSAKANQVKIVRVGSEPQLVDLGDPKYGEVLIYPGDSVEFTYVDKQFYFIAGEVAVIGQKEFHKGITLMQAIIASGGLKKSSIKRAVIRRKSETGNLVPTQYDIKSIRDGKTPDPSLEAGDTIEIGN